MVVEEQRGESPAHVPLDVVGQHARQDAARRVDDLALRSDYRVGYGPGVLEQGKVNFELGVAAFAIATTEVTVAQFQRFLDANPEVKAQHIRRDNPGRIAAALQRLSPDDDGPRIP